MELVRAPDVPAEFGQKPTSVFENSQTFHIRDKEVKRFFAFFLQFYLLSAACA